MFEAEVGDLRGAGLGRIVGARMGAGIGLIGCRIGEGRSFL
jgi:hypothetical protein